MLDHVGILLFLSIHASCLRKELRQRCLPLALNAHDVPDEAQEFLGCWRLPHSLQFVALDGNLKFLLLQADQPNSATRETRHQ